MCTFVDIWFGSADAEKSAQTLKLKVLLKVSTLHGTTLKASSIRPTPKVRKRTWNELGRHPYGKKQDTQNNLLTVDDGDRASGPCETHRW